jgi:hypothetical protein
MPEPRPRTPAQIAAARRNGARSRGPVTEEGKAKASCNALKHGLTALHHLVLEDEVPDALEALIATVTEETGAASEIEARLARRLAIALWKGERAERIETTLFDAAQKLRPPQAGFRWEEADPLTTFDLKRFNAVRGYQAQQGREISRCLKELRLLRKDALAACTGEPDVAAENEPKSPPVPTNDNARPHHMLAETAAWHTPINEPEPDPWRAVRVQGHGTPDGDRMAPGAHARLGRARHRQAPDIPEAARLSRATPGRDRNPPATA